MDVFSPENLEGALSVFVGDAVFDCRPYHHLDAVHIIIHDIIKCWHESVAVNQIKVYLGIRRNLNSDVSLDVVKESSNGQSMVLNPNFLTFLSNFPFEKNDIT